MKKDTHPLMYPAIFRDSEAGVDVFSTTTMEGAMQETVDGTEYQVIPVEISAASHPFYTGEDRVLDTRGRVEKFRSRVQRAKKSEA